MVDAIVSAIKEQVTQEIYEAIQLDLQKQNETIVSLNKKVNVLEKKVNDLQRTSDEQEQYSRRYSLRFHGIPEQPHEDTSQLITDTVREHMGISLNPSDVDRSHHVTPRNWKRDDSNGDSRPRPRPIIIKFATYSPRHAVYSARSKLKGTNIYIHEDLTAERQALVNDLRSHELVNKVWTLDGKVTALLKNGRKVRVASKADIDKL